jgi:hypothetical protein
MVAFILNRLLLVSLIAGWCFLALVAGAVFGAEVPRDALKFQRQLTGEARVVWGLDAPVPAFAAQIHQESAWRPDAQSPFAQGLTQFTPGTAKWIAGVYPKELGDANPFNPGWAIRALVRYDRWLWDRNPAATDCDRFAFALESYNAGLGWVQKETKEAIRRGAPVGVWWGEREKVCLRAGWACKESRDYPKRILLKHQPVYRNWGRLITCEAR